MLYCVGQRNWNFCLYISVYTSYIIIIRKCTVGYGTYGTSYIPSNSAVLDDLYNYILFLKVWM